ncbi:NACHT domain- and WD repeat-containing protein 1 [Mortierella alpina]|nr:NACHT domain- and WD repeat-containing protein 1 [Mortierella alpina]
MSHEPPMVIHSSVSTSPCVLMMDEAVVSHDMHNINSYTGSSNSSNGEGMGASHPFSVFPQLQQQQQYQHQQDTLSCSLCTYADLCLVPQLQICVRIHRNRNQPLMQVLDWSLQHVVEMEGALNDCHQDLISGTAVNERGTMMASCSIDGTVRVWDLNQAFRVVAGGAGDHHCLHQGSTTGVSFVDKVKRFGCPIKSRWLLTGHVGWVNAVAIEDTTVVSGGSDHTVRVWDALTGMLKYLIPDLYTSRPELGLGVYAVAIHGSSVIGSGSVMEGYQLHDLSTGELLFELDEPLSSRDHVRFENELYQQYASRIAITDTVVVTNSKMEGMLCVWSRQTGELMYRIHAAAAVPVPGRHGDRDQEQGGRLVTFEASGPGSRIRREGVAAAAAAADGHHEDEETVHTFKINKSGSMLMCTLCDGRASLIEFGSASERCRIPGRNWVVEATGHGSLMTQTEPQGGEQQQLQEHYHHCGALAWAWTCTGQGSNRVVLV